MKRNLFLPLFIILLLSFGWLSAQTLVSTQAENKKAIMEEFTGTSCGFCPAGHSIIETLLTTYPDDLFVIGYQPFNSSLTSPRSASDPDMRRSFGDAFYNTSYTMGGGRFMPSAFLNRKLFNGDRLVGRSAWTSNIPTILAEASPVNVGLLATYDSTTSILSVQVEVYYTDSMPGANNLYVLLMEDGIVAGQSGSNDPNYVHKHVFRESLTLDQWGDIIPLGPWPGQFHSTTLTFDNSAGAYDMKNCSVMAFVYSPTIDEVYSGSGAHVTEPVNNTNIDDEFARQVSMNVFPNPAQQTAKLRFTLRSAQEVQIELLDVNGKTVYVNPTETFSAGTHQHTMHLDALPSGMYVVKMTANDKVGMTRLFVTH
jgi:hypothetical protein